MKSTKAEPWYKIYGTTVDLRSDIKKYSTGIEAAKITVDYIMSNYSPPYHLMISGGVDSQAMLYAWKLYGRDFIPTAVRYNTDLNCHDLETLDVFSKQEGINIQYIDFDLLDFYQTRYDDICTAYSCASPHFGAHLGMTEGLPGTCIFSGDRLSHYSNAVITAANICLYNASKTRSIVPYFFMHTPEIAYSGILEYMSPAGPLGNKIDIDNRNYHAKVLTWVNSGFPVIPQTKKYTGFEKVKDYYDDHYSHLVTPQLKIRYGIKPSKRTYDLLLRYPYEDKIGVNKFTYLFNEPISTTM